MPSILETKNLTKSYAKQEVLTDITLTLHSSSLTVLVGANGQGKSTLLRILARAEFPDSGEASVLGHSIHTDDPNSSTDLGYVSETIDYHLPLTLNGILNLLAKIHKNWNDDIATGLAKKFDLDLKKKFKNLSRGQKMQFVFLAECARQPKLLILDEITSVLDASVRRYVMEFLSEYAKAGGAVLMATNILSEAEGFATRIVILDRGRIGFDKETSQLDLSANSLEDLFIQHTRKAG